MCYACNYCYRAAVLCSRCLCCVHGYHFYGVNCDCGAAITGDVRVESVSMSPGSPVKSWLESSKAMLRSDVTRSVIANTKANDRCCSCTQCRQNSSGYGKESCCVDGDDCVCERFSTKSIDLITSSIWNPISLSPEIEKSIVKAGDLMDKLPLFLN